MSSKDEVRGSSTFFFPLRTNVEYFALPQGYLTLFERVRQASILYDTLMFEGGVYMATVGEQGSMEMWIPPERVTEETLLDRFEPTGGDHYLRIEGTGSDQGHVLLSGSVERRFRSEFHGVLRELQADQLPWIKVDTFGLTPGGKKLADRLRREDEQNLDLVLPEGTHWLRSKILANLNHDLVLIASLRTSASIDPLYAPMLQHKIIGHHRMQPAPGFLALQVVIPNFVSVPWDTVVELRDQPALVEFREKMISIEKMARSALPEGEIEDLKYQISQTINQELLREIAHLRPKVSRVVGDVMLDLVLGLLPGPIPVGAAVTGVRGIMGVAEANRSWVTPFLRLRELGSDLSR